MLVVERGAPPPLCIDPIEDWVRAPVSRVDIDARKNSLRERALRYRSPTVDDGRSLYYNSSVITVSDAQAALLHLFVDHFTEVVSRKDLEDRVAERVSRPSRNSLDLLIMRLRRRVPEVGLAIRTVRGRGYVLEPTTRRQRHDLPSNYKDDQTNRSLDN